MAENKKYFYMRLKEDYFDSEEQTVLESLPDGYLYSNILLKLYLKSLKRDGLLMFTDMIPYNAQMIAAVTRHQVGTVEKALQIFEQLGIIKRLETGEIYMMDIQNFVGSSTTEADRIREYQRRIANTKSKQLESGVEIYEKSTPEYRDKSIEPKAQSLEPISISKGSVTASATATATRHQYGQYKNVLLSDDEMSKLQSEFPDWEQRIERLSEYIASKGAKYKSHLATIRSWARKDKQENQTKVQTNPALNYAQREYKEDDFSDFFEKL